MEPFNFEVGVLKDKSHFKAYPIERGMKTVAGGPARRQSRRTDGTIAGVSRKARALLKVNWLLKPFQPTKKNADAQRMMKVFWKLVFGENKLNSKRQLENAIQAVVRNPITRADYGKNKRRTARIKGSNRKFIDTGQLFKSITARVRVNRRVSK